MQGFLSRLLLKSHGCSYGCS